MALFSSVSYKLYKNYLQMDISFSKIEKIERRLSDPEKQLISEWKI